MKQTVLQVHVNGAELINNLHWLLVTEKKNYNIVPMNKMPQNWTKRVDMKTLTIAALCYVTTGGVGSIVISYKYIMDSPVAQLYCTPVETLKSSLVCARVVLGNASYRYGFVVDTVDSYPETEALETYLAMSIDRECIIFIYLSASTHAHKHVCTHVRAHTDTFWTCHAPPPPPTHTHTFSLSVCLHICLPLSIPYCLSLSTTHPLRVHIILIYPVLWVCLATLVWLMTKYSNTRKASTEHHTTYTSPDFFWTWLVNMAIWVCSLA